MHKERSILFLSALDFKQKSIQVIRKTPEAYIQAGWDVHYVVSRDGSKKGNYFYENIINPEGVNVYRFDMPLQSIKDRITNHTIRTIVSKISGYLTILQLAFLGNKILKKNEIKVIYGYESHGVLAVNILRLFSKLKKQKIVSRFQGTFYIITIIKAKQYLKRLLNWDSFLALKLQSDLCIMTNDGTQGDQALNYVKSKSRKNLKFWVNGVDEQKIQQEEISKLKENFNIGGNETVFLTVSRLVACKRVDRGIKAIELLVHKYNIKNIKYYIVGAGTEKENLEKLTEEKGLKDIVIFVGAVNNAEVKKYLNIANIFISTYDSSNVGNPLLEAIRANKIIFTLNNGDTFQWIKNKENGFIYDIDENLYENMASDMRELIFTSSLREQILTNIKKTEKEKLWTWAERMKAEVLEVEKLIHEN